MNLVNEEAAELERKTHKKRERQQEKLIKRSIHRKIYKHHDGRDLFELSISELQQLLREAN